MDALDQLARDIGASVDEMKSALTGDREKRAKLDEVLTETNLRITELEQKAARRPGPAGPFLPDTWGKTVIDDLANRNLKADGRVGKLRFEVKALTSATGSAGAFVMPDRSAEPVMLPTRQLTIRDLLDARPTTSGRIEYQRQTQRDIHARVVTEGALKPESFFAFEAADAPVVTVAHWTQASKQILADAPQLMGLIDGELRYGLKDVEEEQLLYGAGGPGNLEGIATLATEYHAIFTDTGATMIDQLRLAMLQARMARYPVTGFVLNPIDWARIETTKDGEGRYIIGNPGAGGGVPRLWGKPVVESDSMIADSFLTGAFGLAARIWDREEASVLISDEDGDNFRMNLVTILAEERMALEVSRPEALVTGSFGNV